MKRVITCTQCGAPLKSSKCEYCGTEFDTDDFTVHKIIYDYGRANISESKCKAVIPVDTLRLMNPEEIPIFVKRDMATQIANDIAKYLDISTYIDPVRYEQHFLGKLKFVLPERGGNDGF